MLNYDTFHNQSNSLHSLPELVTTVVGGVGGVEGEWFGGAAINNKDHVQL